ncbi:Purine nucleoside phosphorylase [Sphingomonas antarctica]
MPHGFLGRTGGVSTGDLASLNCGIGSNDDPALIAENRRRAVEAVAPASTLLGVYQVHGRDCVTVTSPWAEADRPNADALVTATPGLALSILTADCTPVLFADAAAGVIGSAHAGWKGAVAGVTDATIEAMEALGARRHNIHAAIGPCIAQASYEVSDGFGGGAIPEHFFTPGRPGHRHFDLEAYVADRLEAAGIASVHRAGQDTLSQPDRYFSYRRATLAGEPGYGRQISIIALP